MIPLPTAEFTPFLLQQTRLRASLLQSRFGFAIDNHDELQEVLILDCLQRLPKFNAARGNWQGFVRGIVRNHACVLASRQVRRPEFHSLEIDADGNNPETDVPCIDFHADLELSLDVQNVLAGLPEDLRIVAGCLATMPVYRVRQKIGLSQSQLNRCIARLRAAFATAGLGKALEVEIGRRRAPRTDKGIRPNLTEVAPGVASGKVAVKEQCFCKTTLARRAGSIGPTDFIAGGCS
jgi:hypothetical protein